MERERDLVRREYRFVRDGSEGSEEVDPSTRRYEAALFREFVICDLSRHRERLVGLRWRTEAEVRAGRGQRFCGARGCEAGRGLATLEVPFAYREHGEQRRALVKAVLCAEHMQQMMEAKKPKQEDEGDNADEEKKDRKRKKKKKKKKEKKKRRKETQEKTTKKRTREDSA